METLCFPVHILLPQRLPRDICSSLHPYNSEHMETNQFNYESRQTTEIYILSDSGDFDFQVGKSIFFQFPTVFIFSNFLKQSLVSNFIYVLLGLCPRNPCIHFT